MSNSLTRFLSRTFSRKTVYVPYPASTVYSHVVPFRDTVLLVGSNGDITELSHNYLGDFIQLTTVRKA